MSGKSDFKRRHLQMFPGDIPRRDKIAMLEGNERELDRMYSRLEKRGFDIDYRKVSRRYKKEFAQKTNRKIRHSPIESEGD